MIRVVVDTNIFVSAILFGGNCEKILNLAEENRIKLITSQDILKELKEVLQKKFKFDKKMSEMTISTIKEISLVVYPERKLTVIKEMDADNRILECAIEGKADYIISGDKQHILPLKKFQKIRISSPAQFLKFVEKQI